MAYDMEVRDMMMRPGDQGYMPVASDDANRAQITARAFYLLGDYFKGSDSMTRYDPGMSGGNVLGPNQTGVDVGVGQGGEVFIRGRSGQVGSNNPTPAAGTAGAPVVPAVMPMAAMLGNPLVLLGLAVGAYLLMRK